MRKISNLNINNTYRSRNLNTMVSQDVKRLITRVSSKNEPQVLKDIKQERYARHYLIDESQKPLQKGTIEKIFQTKQPVSYYTRTTVPYELLLRLANIKNSSVVYQIHSEFTKEQIKNVQTASMLCKTVVSCPLLYPDGKAKDILFSLWELRYILDRVVLTFPKLKTKQLENRKEYYHYNKNIKRYELFSKYKLQYYRNLHEVLARWRIQLWLVLEDAAEVEYFETKVK